MKEMPRAELLAEVGVGSATEVLAVAAETDVLAVVEGPRLAVAEVEVAGVPWFAVVLALEVLRFVTAVLGRFDTAELRRLTVELGRLAVTSARPVVTAGVGVTGST